MIASFLLTLATAVLSTTAGVAAAPGGRPVPGLSLAAIKPLTNLAACPISSAVLSLPSNQSNVTVASGASPVNIALGVGVQNYTCSAAGTYASAGAVATLMDISCLYGTPGFNKIQNDVFAIPQPLRNAIVQMISKTPLLTGYHYFITNPVTGSGISPKFAKAANGGSDFTVLAKAGAVHSPAGTTNVDWLQLSSISGDWASAVYRVDTVAGQPPANCTGTGSISVPYVAKYWFFQ